MTTPRPPVALPEQPYLRRPSNRQVRRARRNRALMNWVLRGLVDLLVAGAFLWVLREGAEALMTTAGLALDRVEVSGTQRTTVEAIRARLAPYHGRNLLDLDLDRVKASVESDPWVLVAAVKKVLPHTMRVVVAERRPAALALVDGAVQVVDSTGRIIVPIGAGAAYDLPVLTGLERLNPQAREHALRRGVEALRQLSSSHSEWLATVSELNLSASDRISVLAGRDRTEILLDPERVDRNLSEYLAVRSELTRRMGALSCVDLRWSRRLTVRPASAAFNPESL